MRKIYLTMGVAVSLFSVVAAQDAAPPVPSLPRAEQKSTSKSGDPAASHQAVARDDLFSIEVKILEGTEELHQSLVAPKMQGAAIPRAKSGYYPPPPASAPLQNPVALPESRFGGPDPSPKHRDDLEIHPPRIAVSATHGAGAADERDGLWHDARRIPGVTVLAAPKLGVVGGRSGVVQIQSEQIFTYLDPLGDGRFQAKYTDPTELGMKFVLGVQPVAGDDRSVEVSPLEIQLSVLDGREPVEGLDLDVGKPIIATRSLKTTAMMRLGDTRMIPIPSGPKTQAALLLRISRMDSAEKEQPARQSAANPLPGLSSP